MDISRKGPKGVHLKVHYMCKYMINFIISTQFAEALGLVVYIYPVEPNVCWLSAVTDSVLGEYMGDAKAPRRRHLVLKATFSCMKLQ